MMELWSRLFLYSGLIAAMSGLLNFQSTFSQAAEGCAPSVLEFDAGDQGQGRAFLPDPIVSSRNENLLPTSRDLDQFATSVTLLRLNSKGVLSGTYVDVTNDLQCKGKYGAFDLKNQFIFPYRDPRFQEVMTYYFGDQFRASVDQAGYLIPSAPIPISVHCQKSGGDSPYIERLLVDNGQPKYHLCITDSKSTPGASYSDDASTTIHELQHATTSDNYSITLNLNQFWYDEAGALNETLSDFMALIFEDPLVSPVPGADPRIFSRWALGTFEPDVKLFRGAHSCPMYDSRYPDCLGFPGFSVPLNSQSGSRSDPQHSFSTVSYVYPDGMGWPFTLPYSGSNVLREYFRRFQFQEEIHNSGNLMLSALWGVYSAVKNNHNGDFNFSYRTMTQLVHESIRHLPAPTQSNLSPVTYLGFAQNLVQFSASIPEFTQLDRDAIVRVLKSHGLWEAPRLNSPSWMKVGLGTNFQILTAQTPGIYIQDDPAILKSWLNKMESDSSIVTQTFATVDHKLSAGEVVSIWFDIQNDSDVTAGAVLLTVTSKDPSIRILDGSVNAGYLPRLSSTQAQILYSKINGKAIVSALSASNDPLIKVPTGNTYFKTNPHFYKSFHTGIWIKADPDATPGKVVEFEVKAHPSNGVDSVQNFSLTLH
jgi:hypothetical protein